VGHEPGPSAVSRIFRAAEAGEPLDQEALFSLVYAELKAIAARQMADERNDHTLQATALVHETYLRLVGRERLVWANRAHFFFSAAEAMRRILVEHARARRRGKRGGGRRREALNLAELSADRNPEEFLAVDDAIRRLEDTDPRAGAVIRLRYFAGLNVDETALALGLPRRTVEREAAYARAWLHEALR